MEAKEAGEPETKFKHHVKRLKIVRFTRGCQASKFIRPRSRLFLGSRNREESMSFIPVSVSHFSVIESFFLRFLGHGLVEKGHLH